MNNDYIIWLVTTMNQELIKKISIKNNFGGFKMTVEIPQIPVPYQKYSSLTQLELNQNRLISLNY